MRQLLAFFIVSFLLVSAAISQEEPKQEMRAAWVASVANIDWPKYEHRNKPQEQKAELIRMLDLYRSIHLNAIFLQVRPECDALYNSSLEPWSRYLTWTQGTDPGYDPLQFAIEEAHKRGIEVHAWLNPYRINASTNDGEGYYAPGHVYLEHPEWALVYPTGRKILNPGRPEVMSYIGSVVRDIVSNYPLDGIHFDDYFYSYDGTDASLDATEYSLYGNGMSLGDWRRDNVNRMIDTVYSVIQEVNSNVRFGVSPFGIWKNGVPQGIIGLDAFSQIYCDPIAWLNRGSVDYITPQQYWPTGGGQDFETLTNWWAEQCFAKGRHHIPGHGTYRLSDSPGLKKSLEQEPGLHEMKEYFDGMTSKKSIDTNLTMTESFLIRSTSDPVAAWTLGQIGLQIDIVRSNYAKNSRGSVFFSAKDFDRVQGLADYMSQYKYTRPAIIPEMTWKTGSAPIAPVNIRVEARETQYFLMWDHAGQQNDRYAIYTSVDGADANQIILDPSNLKEISFLKEFPLSELDFSDGSAIVITTISAIGKESQPSAAFIPGIDLPIVSLINPASASILGETDSFEWTSGAQNPTYQFQVSTNLSFSNVVYTSGWITGNSFQLKSLGLKGEENYFWRVKAKTTLEGPYSEKRAFSTGFPKDPQVVSPANLAQNISTTPIVRWNSSPSAESIIVQVSESTSFASLAVEELFDAGPGEGRISTELKKDTWYYIRVNASNTYGNSSFSEFKTFRTTAGVIPEVIALAPSDGAIAASFDTLKWETTASQGSITYLMDVALDPDFKNIMSSTGWISPEHIILRELNLEGQRTYYWRVKGKSEYGESEYTPVRSLFAGYPSRPSLIAPAQLSENNPVMITVGWNADSQADSVWVQFSRSSTFEILDHDEFFEAAQSSAMINVSLNGFTWYFARLQARNEYGGSIFSANKYFKTGESNSILQFDERYHLNIFPNPSLEGNVSLEVSIKENANVNIFLTDISGREVTWIVQNRKLNPGSYFFILDEKRMTEAGVYLLHFNANEFTQNFKLIRTQRN